MWVPKWFRNGEDPVWLHALYCVGPPKKGGGGGINTEVGKPHELK